jgi:hypothetical protein
MACINLTSYYYAVYSAEIGAVGNRSDICCYNIVITSKEEGNTIQS